MLERGYEKKAASILSRACIEINGPNPWDIQISNESLYTRVFRDGSLGLGEAYMDGWWDAPRLDQFFYRVLGANLNRTVHPFALVLLKPLLLNLQSRKRAYEVGERHYDIGNDIYRAMLDSRMTYTCGYWEKAENLNEAQDAKLDLVCRKLGLRQGQSVLDIGCGWGSFLKFAVEKYGVRGVGVTVSGEQVKLGRELCRGLPIEILLEDYRDIAGTFDHIVSLGMFEHVGHKNYRVFMEVVHRCLKDDGLFLLHTIGSSRSVSSADRWITKYIFPNGMLPSIKQISAATEELFVVEDLHNFGADYDKTLMVWFENFDSSWEALRARYDERFYRMWKFYLLSCAGGFRARKQQLWQVVLSKTGVRGGYASVR